MTTPKQGPHITKWSKQDPRITKRRVTMTSVTAAVGGKTLTHEAVDFVRPDFLDAYVADAKTRWQSVEVSEEPDAGPGGYDGQTYVPESLSVSDAGTTYLANEG